MMALKKTLHHQIILKQASSRTPAQERQGF
jgi:hypothetical protein